MKKDSALLLSPLLILHQLRRPPVFILSPPPSLNLSLIPGRRLALPCALPVLLFGPLLELQLPLLLRILLGPQQGLRIRPHFHLPRYLPQIRRFVIHQPQPLVAGGDGMELPLKRSMTNYSRRRYWIPSAREPITSVATMIMMH